MLLPCAQCRKAKRRCTPITGELGCLLCKQRQKQCSRSPSSDESRRREASVASVASEALPLNLSADPEFKAIAISVVNLYIQYMHDKPHALFHEPSIRRSVLQGTIPQVVLYSILGVAARFSPDEKITRRAPEFTNVAKSLLKADLEKASLPNIQSCILIGNICLGDSDPDAESLYFVLANRMAQIAKLNIINESDDGITREIKSRLWWTCYLTDTWASGGSGLPRQFNLLNAAPRLPMDERVFSGMQPGDPDVTPPEYSPGFWGYNVKLSCIYTLVADHLKTVVMTAAWDEEKIEDAVLELSVQLTAYEESLPVTMKYSPANLKLQIERGLGRQFIALHLALNHYYTLLFYQYLDRSRPTTTNGKAYADRCKQHALLFSDILHASRTHPGAEALYNIVGHVTVVSSSVLLHTFLFGNADEVQDMRQRLESNFESLVQLRKYWSSVELMINRLVVFQRRCLQSEMGNTHRLNKWMVKFLLQHALALDDDDAEGDELEDLWSQSTRHPHVDEEFPTTTRLFERSKVAQSIIMDMQMR